MDRAMVIAGLMLAALVTDGASVWAQDATRTFTISPDYRFTERSGEALYNATCAGCHMPDGRGAKGAGHYPALADNPSVGAAPYVISNVLHGRRGMPSFGGEMDDEQVAAVVNYVRTHFGNGFAENVTPDQVRNLR
jgi:mono/diheme cytochrome c family protein